MVSTNPGGLVGAWRNASGFPLANRPQQKKVAILVKGDTTALRDPSFPDVLGSLHLFHL